MPKELIDTIRQLSDENHKALGPSPFDPESHATSASDLATGQGYQGLLEQIQARLTNRIRERVDDAVSSFAQRLRTIDSPATPAESIGTAALEDSRREADEMQASIRGLYAKIDALAAKGGAANGEARSVETLLDSLEDLKSALHEERAAPRDLGPIENTLRQIHDRLDTLGESPREPGRELELLEKLLEQLSGVQESVRALNSGSTFDSSAIERTLEHIDGQLDQVQSKLTDATQSGQGTLNQVIEELNHLRNEIGAGFGKDRFGTLVEASNNAAESARHLDAKLAEIEGKLDARPDSRENAAPRSSQVLDELAQIRASISSLAPATTEAESSVAESHGHADTIDIAARFDRMLDAIEALRPSDDNSAVERVAHHVQETRDDLGALREDLSTRQAEHDELLKRLEGIDRKLDEQYLDRATAPAEPRDATLDLEDLSDRLDTLNESMALTARSDEVGRMREDFSRLSDDVLELATSDSDSAVVAEVRRCLEPLIERLDAIESNATGEPTSDRAVLDALAELRSSQETLQAAIRALGTASAGETSESAAAQREFDELRSKLQSFAEETRQRLHGIAELISEQSAEWLDSTLLDDRLHQMSAEFADQLERMTHALLKRPLTSDLTPVEGELRRFASEMNDQLESGLRMVRSALQGQLDAIGERLNRAIESDEDARQNTDLAHVEERLDALQAEFQNLANRIDTARDAGSESEAMRLTEAVEAIRSAIDEGRSRVLEEIGAKLERQPRTEELCAPILDQLGQVERRIQAQGSESPFSETLSAQLGGLETRLLEANRDTDANSALEQRLDDLIARQASTRGEAVSCDDLERLEQSIREAFERASEGLTSTLRDRIEDADPSSQVSSLTAAVNASSDKIDRLLDLQASATETAATPEVDLAPVLEAVARIAESSSRLEAKLEESDGEQTIVERLNAIAATVEAALEAKPASDNEADPVAPDRLVEQLEALLNEWREPFAKLDAIPDGLAQSNAVLNELLERLGEAAEARPASEDTDLPDATATILAACQQLESLPGSLAAQFEAASSARERTAEALTHVVEAHALPERVLELPDLVLNLRRDFSLLVHTINNHLEETHDLSAVIANSITGALDKLLEDDDTSEVPNRLRQALDDLQRLSGLPQQLAELLPQLSQSSEIVEMLEDESTEIAELPRDRG